MEEGVFWKEMVGVGWGLGWTWWVVGRVVGGGKVGGMCVGREV